MYRLLRPLLFLMDPESAHGLILNLIRLAGAVPGLRDAIHGIYKAPGKPVELFGLRFMNPVGLAAGFDKDGIGLRGLSLLGFGHIELGTVTPNPQTGNPRPRIFRLVEREGLINRMGFPGKGAFFVENQVKNTKRGSIILGVNIGKNTTTPLESAVDDYKILIDRFAPIADYLVINISSPNTVGLRNLQARKALEHLLADLDKVRKRQEKLLKKRVPLLVKISPDMTDAQLKDAVETIQYHELDGVVATNTSISSQITDQIDLEESGGISGKPLNHLSTKTISKISKFSNGNLPIIGVGGIGGAAEARSKIDAGASLIQVYTGLIYRGPGLVKDIVAGLSD
jgi:dihydroorotate dehydrogenase